MDGEVLRCSGTQPNERVVAKVLVGAPTEGEERRSLCRYLLNLRSQLGPLNWHTLSTPLFITQRGGLTEFGFALTFSDEIFIDCSN